MNLTSLQKAKARDQLVELLNKNSNAFQYFITLQTKLRPAEYQLRREQQLIDMSADFRHFQNRLNSAIYRTGAKNKPKLYSLLSVPVIEGLHVSSYGIKTMHFHVAIGNVPSNLTMEQLMDLVKASWSKTKYGKSDVHIRAVCDSDTNYITKEVLKNEGHGIDWINVSIPEIALQPQP